MARRFDGAKYDDWRARLAKFDVSGLTVAEFCRREQVSQANFYCWARRIRQRDDPKTAGIDHADAGAVTSRGVDTVEYVEVVVGDSIRVRMPAGQPDPVAALVRHLQDAPHVADASAATNRFQRIELAHAPAAQQ